MAGDRAERFENRALAGFPSLSRGFDFFDGLNQWSIDHLPLRADAVRFRTDLYRDVFDQLPPQTLAAGPVSDTGGAVRPPSPPSPPWPTATPRVAEAALATTVAWMRFVR